MLLKEEWEAEQLRKPEQISARDPHHQAAYDEWMAHHCPEPAYIREACSYPEEAERKKVREAKKAAAKDKAKQAEAQAEGKASKSQCKLETGTPVLEKLHLLHCLGDNSGDEGDPGSHCPATACWAQGEAATAEAQEAL